MKEVEVVAAVIHDTNGHVFATQRGYGEFKDGWEFPGGKIEPGEGKEAALIREIREELETEITIEDYIDTIQYSYPNFHLTMHCFFCSVKNGHLTLTEHEAARWLDKNTFLDLDWLPADRLILEKIMQKMNWTDI